MKKLRRAFGSLKNIGLHSNDSSNSSDIINYSGPHRSSSTSTILRAVNPEVSYVSYDVESLNAEASVVNYIDPIRLQDHLFTKLHKWTYLGDLSKVRKFIKKVDINAVDNDSRTCLHLCSYEGHMDILLHLLSSGANSDVKDRDGRTPIFKATERCHLVIVQILLQHKRSSIIKIEIKSEIINKYKPFNGDGSRGFCRFWNSKRPKDRENKADFHVKDNMDNSLLHVAVQAGSIDLTELYLGMGLGILLQNMYGQTPLHMAASNVQIEIAKALLTHGEFDIDVKDKDGVTPVMLAVKSGCRPLLDILIEAGADVTLQDCSGWNAASYARFSGYIDLHAYLTSLGEKKIGSQISNEGKSFGMLGLDRKGSENSPIPINSRKFFEDEKFEGVPIDALEDSWNDDSESFIDNAKTKIEMKNLFISESKNNSPSDSPYMGLSSSLTSLGPPKPPRLYASTPNLTDDSLYFKSKDAFITVNNSNINLKLCQNVIDRDFEENEILISHQNNAAVSHRNTMDMKIQSNSDPRDYRLIVNEESHLLQHDDNPIFSCDLTEDDVAFEDDSDALPSSEDENETRKCIKEHLSIIELPMHVMSSPKQIFENLEVNEIINSESDTNSLKEPSEEHNASNSMSSLIDDTKERVIKSESLRANFETSYLKNIAHHNCIEFLDDQSSNKKTTQDDLDPTIAIQVSECKVAMRPIDNLHQVDEMWEANACLEIKDASLNDSVESNEHTPIKVNSIDDIGQKKVFFGDSKKNIFNDTENDCVDCIPKFDEGLNDIAVSFEKIPESINDFGMKALDSFLDISDENYESMVRKYIYASKLPQKSEDLEILVRKLRILLNREYMKNSSLKSSMLHRKLGDDCLQQQLEQHEKYSFQLHREVLKFSSQLNSMSYKNALSEHEKLFTSTCLNEVLKKIASLEKEKESMKFITIENQCQMSKLRDAIEIGNILPIASEEKLNHHSTRFENGYSQTDVLPIVNTECQTTLLEDNGLKIVSVTNVGNASSQISINTDENFVQTSLEWNGNKVEAINFGTQTMDNFLSIRENSCQTDEETNSFNFIPDCEKIKSNMRTTDCLDYRISLNNSSTQTDAVLTSFGVKVEVDNANSFSQTEPIRIHVNDETIRKMINSYSQTENNVSIKFSQPELSDCECNAKPNVDVAIQTQSILTSVQTCGTQTSLYLDNNCTQTSDIKLECCDIALSTDAVIQIDREAQTKFIEKQRMESEITLNLVEPMADLLKSMDDLREAIQHKENSNPQAEIAVVNRLDKFSNCQESMLRKLDTIVHELANPGIIITELKSNRDMLTKMFHHIDNLKQLELDLKTNSSKSLDILSENKSIFNDIRIGTLEIPNQLSKMLSNSIEELNAGFVSKIDEQQVIISNDSHFVGSKIAQLDSKMQVIKEDFMITGSNLKEISGNVNILINERDKNANTIRKLSENEKYLKHHFQLLEKGMEEVTSESNQKVIKNLKFLISNVDETVAENFQIVLNLLNDFEGNFIAKINKIHESELAKRSNETSVLTNKLTELQSSLTAFRSCFEANGELVSNSIFDCGVIEAIRGGDDQALTSLNIQNKSVLKSVESCKCMLEKIILNQEHSILNIESYKTGIQEDIENKSTDNNLYENKIEVLQTECEMLRTQIMSKNESLYMEVKRKIHAEERLDSLMQEYQSMSNDFLHLKKAYEKLLEQENDFRKSLPQNVNIEIIKEDISEKSELCNLEQSLKSVKEENKCLYKELKHVKDAYDNKLSEYKVCIENLTSLNANYEKRIEVLLQYQTEPKLPTNIANGFFHELQDLNVSKKAIECALKEKRKIVFELKSRITELESEKEEFEADVILKTSLLTKLKRDYSKQQRTIYELKQNLSDQMNRNDMTQELEHKLGELECEISNKHSLILSLRERLSGLAQEKRELANSLSLKDADNLNSKVLLKEREAAVQASNELKHQLECITHSIKQEFIPKSKLDSFYQDVESYFESVLAEKKQMWISVAKEELKAKERKNVLLEEREMSLKNEITSLQEEVKLLKSNLLLLDRSGQLWRSRYNKLFQECHKVPKVQTTEISKCSMDDTSRVSDIALKLNEKTPSTLPDDKKFQNVLSEINELLKNTYEDSIFIKMSQSYNQNDSSFHQNTSENLSDYFTSSEIPFKRSSFLNSLHSNKRGSIDVAERDSGMDSTPRVGNSSFVFSSLSPSIQNLL